MSITFHPPEARNSAIVSSARGVRTGSHSVAGGVGLRVACAAVADREAAVRAGRDLQPVPRVGLAEVADEWLGNVQLLAEQRLMKLPEIHGDGRRPYRPNEWSDHRLPRSVAGNYRLRPQCIDERR